MNGTHILKSKKKRKECGLEIVCWVIVLVVNVCIFFFKNV